MGKPKIDKSGVKASIICIDSYSDDLKSMAEYLKERGYDVHAFSDLYSFREAESSGDLERLMGNGNPLGIITEVMFAPQITDGWDRLLRGEIEQRCDDTLGLKVLKKIRDGEYSIPSSTPIIFFTVRSNRNIKGRLAEQKFVGYVQKPSWGPVVEMGLLELFKQQAGDYPAPVIARELKKLRNENPGYE